MKVFDPHEALADAIRPMVGATPISLDEIRNRLGAAGIDLPGPDEHGFDGVFRAVQYDPSFTTSDPRPRHERDEPTHNPDVARTEAVVADISWIVHVDATWAEVGRLVDHESIAPLLGPALGAELRDDPIIAVGHEGRSLGPIGVIEHPLGDGTTDVLIGPRGWLEHVAGSLATITIGSDHTLRISPLPSGVITDEPDPGVASAVAAAFDDVARDRAITTTTGEPMIIGTCGFDELAIEAVLQDRAAFERAPIPRLADVVVAAGLEHDGRTVAAGGTDWDEYDAWRMRNRLMLVHGIDEEQATRVQFLVGCALSVAESGDLGFGATQDEQIGAIALMARVLDDADVAVAAWEEWRQRDAIPEGIADFTDALTDVFDETVVAGVAWLGSRLAFERGDAQAGLEALHAATEADGTPHAAALVDLAATSADRGATTELRAELQRVGRLAVPDDSPIALLANGLTLELEHFGGRPRRQVGRNERCPCGSGRKYKQCHLGTELHPLAERAEWLWRKAERFVQVTNSDELWYTAERLAGGDDELAEHLIDSGVAVSLRLHEHGDFDRFLSQRGALLPGDELQLATTWLDAPRDVFQVTVSNLERVELQPVSGGASILIEETLPPTPMPTDSYVVARPLAVSASSRLYGGLVAIDPSSVDDVVEVLDGSPDEVIDGLSAAIRRLAT